jgi:hypothetical protein
MAAMTVSRLLHSDLRRFQNLHRTVKWKAGGIEGQKM